MQDLRHQVQLEEAPRQKDVSFEQLQPAPNNRDRVYHPKKTSFSSHNKTESLQSPPKPPKEQLYERTEELVQKLELKSARKQFDQMIAKSESKNVANDVSTNTRSRETTREETAPRTVTHEQQPVQKSETQQNVLQEALSKLNLDGSGQLDPKKLSERLENLSNSRNGKEYEALIGRAIIGAMAQISSGEMPPPRVSNSNSNSPISFLSQTEAHLQESSPSISEQQVLQPSETEVVRPGRKSANNSRRVTRDNTSNSFVQTEDSFVQQSSITPNRLQPRRTPQQRRTPKTQTPTRNQQQHTPTRTNRRTPKYGDGKARYMTGTSPISASAQRRIQQSQSSSEEERSPTGASRIQISPPDRTGFEIPSNRLLTLDEAEELAEMQVGSDGSSFYSSEYDGEESYYSNTPPHNLNLSRYILKLKIFLKTFFLAKVKI